MRQPNGGRLVQAMLLGCLATGLALPVMGQAPSSGASPSSAKTVSAIASATPAAAATPAVASTPLPSGQRPLVLPTPVSDAKALSDWRADGTVGKSTFVDKIRKVTWTLAFVCLFIWAVGKVAGKATLQRWGLPVESDSLIEVLEKKRLSPGRSIMLLRVGPKVLAVAATESGYTTLTEIDAEALKQCRDEAAGATSEESPAPPAAGQTPTDIAKHYLSIIPGLGAKK